MATFTKPVASSIGGLEFGVLSQDDIKAISVKRIYNTPTLDSFNNPVPGGLYDPSLGAWGDNLCTTCRMTSWSCAGHPGHIELPIRVFNITFFDQMFRLLKAQCVYCHKLRISRLSVNDYVCKLRLLQYGLVDEAAQIDTIGRKIHGYSKTYSRTTGGVEPNEDSDINPDEDEPGNTVEVDPLELIAMRKAFTRRCLKLVKAHSTRESMSASKDPVASEERRRLLRTFFKDIVTTKNCASCHGINPGYRKDKFSKIFRKVLAEKQRQKMQAAAMNIPHPLVMLKSHQEAEEARKKKMTNGLANGESTDENSNVVSELHGAEEEIIRAKAVMSRSSAANGEAADDSGGFIPSPEIYAALSLLFQKEGEILNLVYNSRPSQQKTNVGADMFFIKNILVPPNKFRPAAAQGPNQIMEGDQNGPFNEILKSCDLINQISKDRQNSLKDATPSRWSYTDLLQAMISLQEAVNGLIDKDRAGYPVAKLAKASNGVKQILEKKEGLFRKNMMGKRVNFAARSVISPDPNIETNEIGVPLVFAKKLTYPEPVTNHNFWEMKQAVINGPDKYPGASAIENEVGQVINLKFKTLDERTALANQLLAPSNWRMKGTRNKKVYRHLTTGDVVLMNRQPTLHKPSIMGHKARVLPNERTIRMHYANCNTYNADFDGDEMNMHFPQNELARAEAMMLADADHQYLVATSGKPLRGLIQDHISMGTWFTSRDTFFDREDYHQLLYSCLRPENSHIVSDKIELMPPTIWKPEPLWTGKQVISTILRNIKPPSSEGLNLDSKSSTPGERWGDGNEEGNVIFRDGELLCGILDKKQLGPTAGGVIDSIHEIYGHAIAGKLIGILGRLLTKFLHMHAFTCGMDDLRLTKDGDRRRREKLYEAPEIGREVALKYVMLDKNTVLDQDAELRRRLEDVLRDDEKQSGLDSVSNARTSKLTSEITAACLPNGLVKQFPLNHMQSMTISGAKGSSVNANLISCNLGQQVLEGRRVPVMVSGKTLPSFRAYETHPIAGGYVSGRFLTGIKPQEYYFHTMAGREGLIDTAVKTSRSGYLQRCLIKGMEGLKAEYDTSVRDTTDGSMVQFLYGEDGLDITKQVHLRDFKFLAANHVSIMSHINVSDFRNLEKPDVADWHKDAMKKLRKTGRLDAKDPVLSQFHPGGNFGSVSEAFSQALKQYEEENEDKLIKNKKSGVEGVISKKSFETMMNMKYMNSIVEPGEAVGIVASQSIGEPSTQMTLNTFHLAGHSAKNVTLGIPRLREIVMTASANIMTPTMRLNLIDEITPEDGAKFAKSISRLSLAEVIDSLQIRESISTGSGDANSKIYDIHIEFFPAEEYMNEYAIQTKDVLKALQWPFVKRLQKSTERELKKREDEKKKMGNSAAQPDVGVSVGTTEDAPGAAVGGGDADDMPDDDNDEDQDDAKRAMANMNRSHQISYEGPDGDEQDIIRRQDSLEADDDEDDGNSPQRRHGAETSSDESEDSDDENEVSKTIKSIKHFEKEIRGKHPEFTKFRFDPTTGSSCHIQLQYDISTPKLLLLPLVEEAARHAVIHHIPGIRSCTYVPADPLKEEKAYVETEGVSLVAMWDYQDIVRPHSLRTNSISHMLELYGVEAARASIVREMDDVFKGHSISVDNRHLNLIGDVMTHSGGFRAFNRNGLVLDSSSPLAKMSFETTVGFLKDAVLERDFDNLRSPSSRIVVGRVGSVGTGGCDVLAPVA